MEKVRWGIISTARIGTEKVVPAMQRADNCEITAIASRDPQTATAAADRLGIGTAYGSYDELLADPNIDAVYNPLPNHLHVPVSIQAIHAGKHVLCEKPIGLSSQEARQLIDAADAHPELKVMEAFMYRHHPQWRRALELVKTGGIGQLRTIQSFFSYYNVDADDIRNKADMGGGGLMDIGCYPISLSRFVFESEPTRVVSLIERDPHFHIDRMASAILDFGTGTASFTCSTQLESYQRVHIHGTKGRVEIEIPFNAPPDRPCRIWHQTSGMIEEIEFDVCDQYTIQGALFAKSIIEDAPVPTPLCDALSNMKVIEAIFQSGLSGQWVATS